MQTDINSLSLVLILGKMFAKYFAEIKLFLINEIINSHNFPNVRNIIFFTLNINAQKPKNSKKI